MSEIFASWEEWPTDDTDQKSVSIRPIRVIRGPFPVGLFNLEEVLVNLFDRACCGPA
jgi:hypothetical protein